MNILGGNDSCQNKELSCRNGGICRITRGIPYCKCPTGFKGSLCSISQNDYNQENVASINGIPNFL